MAGFDWSRYAVGGATRPDSFTGMDPAFNGALQQLFQAAPPQYQLQVGSGFRSIERQRQLWEASDKSGKMVARPGGSQHNHGRAADLSAGGRRLDKASPEVRQWVHDNAPKYGLTFPMSYEAWHVEPIGARGGKAHAAQSVPAAPVAGAQPAEAGVARMMSPTPMTQQPGATGPAPAAFGDLVGQTAVQSIDVPAAPNFGELLAMREQKKQAEAEAQAADQARKSALFGDSIFGIYG